MWKMFLPRISSDYAAIRKKMIQQDSTGCFLFGFYEKYKLFPEYFKRYSLYLQYKNSLEKHFSETNLVEHLK